MPVFEAEMNSLKEFSEDAWSFLVNINPKLWTRVAFSTYTKSQVLTNNMCEQFNSKIVQARGKPIISMIEEIRHYVIVWDLSGVPCVHAIAAYGYINLQPEDYVLPYMRSDAFDRTYEPFLERINGRNLWSVTGLEPVQPSKLKRSISRPKKRRRKDVTEQRREQSQQQKPGPNIEKLKRRLVHTCSKCGLECHNRKGCKGPPAAKPNKPKQEKQNADKNKAPTTSTNESTIGSGEEISAPPHDNGNMRKWIPYMWMSNGTHIKVNTTLGQVVQQSPPVKMTSLCGISSETMQAASQRIKQTFAKFVVGSRDCEKQ